MTTPDPAPTTPPTTPPPAPAQEQAEDWKTKYEETLKEARKHEDRAKANAAAAKELEALRQSSMTEQQKAVEAAKAEARTEALREVGGRLAEAAIRVAAAGRPINVDALIKGIDPVKFLDDTGEPNTKQIAAWMDEVAPVETGTTTARSRDLGQGVRGGTQDNGDPAQDFAKFIRNQLSAQS